MSMSTWKVSVFLKFARFGDSLNFSSIFRNMHEIQLNKKFCYEWCSRYILFLVYIDIYRIYVNIYTFWCISIHCIYCVYTNIYLQIFTACTCKKRCANDQAVASPVLMRTNPISDHSLLTAWTNGFQPWLSSMNHRWAIVSHHCH